MKIGELAEKTQCSAETIRYYEKIGLLPEPERLANNYRQYGPVHVGRLRFIRNCRSLDMTHEEIRHLLQFITQPESGCEPVTAVISDHLHHVDVRIQELTQLRQQLLQLKAACSHENSAQACGILDQISNMDPLPENETHLG